MARVLVTGGSGFLGGALAKKLAATTTVRVAFRRAPTFSAFADVVTCGELGPDTDWSRALEDVDTVVHAAGLAHGRYGERALMRVSAEGTAKLARDAEAAGVRRFVLVSSIKAACNSTPRCAAIGEATQAAPTSRYGRTKLAGESAALAVGRMETVVLRPPLVFAVGAKANFRRLVQLADTDIPLPFTLLSNRRSLISRDSLASAAEAVLSRDGPTGVFNITDGPPVTPPEIIAALRAGFGRRARMFALPGLDRLLPLSLSQSLEVDDSAFRSAYGYGARNAVDVREELRACASAWRAA